MVEITRKTRRRSVAKVLTFTIVFILTALACTAPPVPAQEPNIIYTPGYTLSLSSVATPDELGPSSNITYTTTVTNMGPGTVTNFTMWDLFPKGFAAIAVTSDAGPVSSQDTNGVQIASTLMSPGEVFTLTVNGVVDLPVAAPVMTNLGGITFIISNSIAAYAQYPVVTPISLTPTSSPPEPTICSLTPTGVTDVLVPIRGSMSRTVTVANTGSSPLHFGFEGLHSDHPVFGKKNSIGVEERAGLLHAMDFDADGDMDVVTGSDDEDRVSWWENHGDGGRSWTKHTLPMRVSNPKGIVIADIDGNGHQDMFIEGHHWGRPIWLEADGADFSSWTTRYMNVRSFYSDSTMAIADMDNDGRLDLVSSRYSYGNIQWWKQPANPSDAWRERYIAYREGRIPDMAIADINGDGYADCVAADEREDHVRWYDNYRGDGYIFRDYVIPIEATNVSTVLAYDIDADGDQDILTSSRASGEIVWLINGLSNAANWQRMVVDESITSPTPPKLADIDGDGDQDIVSASRLTSFVGWWENEDGVGGSWTRHAATTRINQPQLTEVADLDGDERIDIVGVGGYFNQLAWWDQAQTIPWLTVYPESGVVATGATTDVIVTLDSEHYQGGDVAATSLTFVCNDAGTPERDVPISMMVDYPNLTVGLDVQTEVLGNEPAIRYVLTVTNEGPFSVEINYTVGFGLLDGFAWDAYGYYDAAFQFIGRSGGILASEESRTYELVGTAHDPFTQLAITSEVVLTTEPYTHRTTHSNSFATVLDDFDGDGTPDFMDPDDDGDGIGDLWETHFGLNPFDPVDATTDWDGDGRDQLTEYNEQTDPLVADTTPATPAPMVNNEVPYCDDRLGKPFCRIQSALQVSSPSSTITIADGSYTGRFSLVEPISLIGSEDTVVFADRSRWYYNGSVFQIAPTTVVHLANMTIADGDARAGAGINNLGELALSNVVIRDNHAGNDEYSSYGPSARGGGIFNGGTLDMVDVTIRDNIASGGRNRWTNSFGGGVYNSSGAVLNVSRSSIVSNGAYGSYLWSRYTSTRLDGYGGAIYNDGGSVTLDHVTVSGNEVSGYSRSHSHPHSPPSIYHRAIGSAIYNTGSGAMSIGHSTIADNNGYGDGGTTIYSPTNLTLANTVVAANRARMGDVLSIHGSVHSEGYNLITIHSHGTISGDTNSNIMGVDPLLHPLNNYGGLTETHALKLASPAIDQGSCAGVSFVDQRGIPRPIDVKGVSEADDGCDIGAVEYDSRDNDGDKLPNEWERHHGLDPNDKDDKKLDPDFDGLVNEKEFKYGTDPNNPDSDGDGLNDYEEVKDGNDGFKTNPLNIDTDGDELDDLWEVQNGFDPTDPSDASADVDNDHLTALEEIRLGTDWNNPDTDGDTLIDGWEHLYGHSPTTMWTRIVGEKMEQPIGWQPSTWLNDEFPKDMQLVSNRLYIAGGENALEIYDFPITNTPYRFSALPRVSGTPLEIQVEGGYAYMASFDAGLQVYDVSSPSSPSLVGSLEIPGRAKRLHIDGDTAYVVSWDDDVQIVDVSAPTNPVLVGAYYVSEGNPNYSPVRDVFVKGDVAYVARINSSSSSGPAMHVVDVTDPSTPITQSTVPHRYGAYSVIAESNYAYGAFSFGFGVVDVADPTNAMLVGTSYMYGSRDYIAKSSNFVYVAARDRIDIFDVSDPTRPEQLISKYIGGGYIEAIAVQGKYVLVLHKGYGVRVYTHSPIDSDQDGLRDDWEIEFFGDLSAGPDDDSDADGLSNWGEMLAGLDPTDADTDGDGLNDGYEVNHLLNPFEDEDNDGDGMSDAAEVVAGTDPRDAASHTRLSIGKHSDGAGKVISIVGVPDRNYQIFFCSDLEAGVWKPLTKAKSGEGSMLYFDDTNDMNRCYYKVSVQQAD